MLKLVRSPSAAGVGGRVMRWPGQCEVCRRWQSARLCDDCVARFAPPLPRCQRCGLSLGAPALACGDCLTDPPPFTRTVVLADYGFPWDSLISAFKFRDQPELARALAWRLQQVVQAEGASQAQPASAPRALPLPLALLPLPLAPARLAQRGFNQAWELARRLAPALGLQAWSDVLLRPLDSAHQAESTRAQRQHNLRGAFMVDPSQRPRIAGLHLALVDDVITTGATGAEAARELLRNGAARVDLWALARTPKSGG